MKVFIEGRITEDKAHEIYNAHALKGEVWFPHYGDFVEKNLTAQLEVDGITHEEAFTEAVRIAERLLPAIQTVTGRPLKGDIKR